MQQYDILMVWLLKILLKLPDLENGCQLVLKILYLVGLSTRMAILVIRQLDI